ncbi:2-amino-4-hydroxy-6-hydroxymethyldihydropteridinediphosphokinase [Pseudomonas cedrina]|uniref:2-amino-4-hydroxy-6-hydroxymethyldihydropteridine diphosphokinase n=2 Tax=Pseudomonas cedrina TaxID=651740 RepID=A0ABY0URL8_PSECE|nr:2-amino-4-hydroxy-6-hydroxymethyldihydropteridine diphosphokinase [Pseudomonas cedrina]SDT08704.1 2-amino-4-hydroxy-6-hydroxymethyldihydropteridinediphosphokinase [Pseudomonas cedrina]
MLGIAQELPSRSNVSASLSNNASYEVVLGLGSNHRRRHNLRAAMAGLEHILDMRQCSDIYVSRDVTGSGPAYFNIVVVATTLLSESSLERYLKQLETQQGRVQGRRAIVPLDVDVLLFTPSYSKVPVAVHRDLCTKAHILWPMFQLFPEGAHPDSGELYRQMLRSHAEKDHVQRLYSSSGNFDFLS